MFDRQASGGPDLSPKPFSVKIGAEQGKSSLWRGQKQIADFDSGPAVIDLDRLIKRAESQLDQVEQPGLKAAKIVFG